MYATQPTTHIAQLQAWWADERSLIQVATDSDIEQQLCMEKCVAMS